MAKMGLRKGNDFYIECVEIVSSSTKITKSDSLIRIVCHIGETDAELLGEVVHKVFYRNRDLNLLLVLLASASGIASAFQVMVLFDEDFR